MVCEEDAMGLSYYQMDRESVASRNVLALIETGTARYAKITEKKVAPPPVDEPIFYYVASGTAVVEIGSDGRESHTNMGEGYLFRGIWVPRGIPVTWRGNPAAHVAVFVGEHFLDKLFSPTYPAQTLFPVYCPVCWWSDAWEGTQFGLDWNPSRSFFDHFKELQLRVPRISILAMKSVNSDYTNNAADNKNCYLIFAAENNEDCYYGRLVQSCTDCVDCDYIYDSQRCYGSLDCRNCYNTHLSEKSQGCNDVLFGFNLSGCSNCILCTNLRNKEYHIENKPVSKEEYEHKRAEILSSRECIDATRIRFEELKKGAIIKYADLMKCENSSGDYLFNCHDTTRSFDTTNAKESAYVNDALDPIDCYDGNNIYYRPELCYELMGVLKTYNCQFNTYIFYTSNVLYSDSCHNTNDSIGCIGLRKNQWCILNKQYGEGEYKKIKNDIISALRAEGKYGEFFFSGTLAIRL